MLRGRKTDKAVAQARHSKTEHQHQLAECKTVDVDELGKEPRLGQGVNKGTELLWHLLGGRQ